MEEMYKKKNLKFDKNLGLGRNLRAVERSTARAESRHTRFSLLRCLDDSENQPIEKKEEAVSKIPTFGKPNCKAPMSRAEMLKKWKEEKQMKLQQEMKSKKPVFKMAGFVAPKPVQTFPSFGKSTNKTPSTSDSRLKTSADSKTRFDNKSHSKTLKETNMQPSFSSKASSSNSTKLLNKVSGTQSSNRKIPTSGSSNLKVKQDSHIQLPNKSNTTLQKPSYISTKQIKNQETRTQMPIKSQTVPKKASFTTTTKEVNSKLHSSSVPKLTESKNLKPSQTLSNGIPRKNQNKIPEPITSQKEFHSQLPNKSKTTLQKPSFLSTTQKKNEINSCRIGKGPEKTATQVKQAGIPFKNNLGPKPQIKSTSKIGLPVKKKEDSSKVSFRCELSHIEPAEDKFVAPKGFLFHPPTELSFSFLEDGGISAIFSKLRAGTERTSTPKRADLKEMEEEVRKKSFIITEESPKLEVFSAQVQDPVNDSNSELSENSPEIKMKEYVPVDKVSDFGEEKKTSLVEQDSCQNSPKCSDVDKLQTDEESCHVTDSISDKLEAKNQDPVINILEVSLPIFEKESPLLKEVAISEFTLQPKSDLLDDEDGIFKMPEIPEKKKNIDVINFPKQELNLEEPKMQDPTKSSPEAGSSTFEEKGPLLPSESPSISTILQKKELLTDDVSVVSRLKPFTRSSEIKTHSFRRSEMPLLESINESLENSSLLESPPKPRKRETLRKVALSKDFTPRRSLRLAKLNEEFDSPECLFDVRPSFYATPPDSRNGACSSRNLTYDFDNLHLETPAEVPLVVDQRSSTRSGKVSLLYTPPKRGRVSTVRKSIKGDLMSFSPDV